MTNDEATSTTTMPMHLQRVQHMHQQRPARFAHPCEYAQDEWRWDARSFVASSSLLDRHHPRHHPRPRSPMRAAATISWPTCLYLLLLLLTLVATEWPCASTSTAVTVGDGGTVRTAYVDSIVGASPASVTLAPNGVLYMCERGTHRIIQLVRTTATPATAATPLTTTVLAGSGTSGMINGACTLARFQQPAGIDVRVVNDTLVKLYVSDTNNHLIRIVTVVYNTPVSSLVAATSVGADSGALVFTAAPTARSCYVATLAGDVRGYADGPTLNARFSFPSGLVLARGGLIVTDRLNHCLRFVPLVLDSTNLDVDSTTPVTPAQRAANVTTLTGQPTLSGVLSGAPGTARLSSPIAVSVARGPDLPPTYTLYNTSAIVFVAHSNAIALLDGANFLYQVGGALSAGYIDGALYSSRFSTPSGIQADDAGHVYISDSGNNVLRVIVHLHALQLDTAMLTSLAADTWTNSVVNVSTTAGTAIYPGFTDGAPLTSQWRTPGALSLYGHLRNSNLLYIVDEGNSALRTATTLCPLPCLNGGNCTEQSVCTCPTKYVADDCSMPVCTPACQTALDGTVCLAPDLCGCPSGYGGAMCASAQCSPSCVNGDCVRPNVCSCHAGWSGALCDQPVCAQTCQNGGTCVANNTCQCTTGWNGTDCSSAICSQQCLNGGTCTQPDTCTCTSSWNDTDCSQPVCSRPCLNGGTCTAPNTCTCPYGWNGTDCSHPVCSSPCVHGNCTGPDLCSCNAGWTGSACSQAVCTDACMNGGVCFAPDQCQCTPQWTNATCVQPVCNSPACDLRFQTCSMPNMCTNVCPNCTAHGTCNFATGTCNCTDLYEGSDCNTPICVYLGIRGCRNNGTCVGPNQCVCPPMYEGTFCQTPKCTSVTCANGGTCSSPDVCQCTSSWTGVNCTTPLCAGTLSNGTYQVGCLNGTCVGRTNTFSSCQCPDGFGGTLCDGFVCSGCTQGKCTGPNICTCDAGYKGPKCNIFDSKSPSFLETNQQLLINVGLGFIGFIVLMIFWQARAYYDRKLASRYAYHSEFDARKEVAREERRKLKEKQRQAAIRMAKKAGVPVETLFLRNASAGHARRGSTMNKSHRRKRSSHVDGASHASNESSKEVSLSAAGGIGGGAKQKAKKAKAAEAAARAAAGAAGAAGGGVGATKELARINRQWKEHARNDGEENDEDGDEDDEEEYGEEKEEKDGMDGEEEDDEGEEEEDDEDFEEDDEEEDDGGSGSRSGSASGNGSGSASGSASRSSDDGQEDEDEDEDEDEHKHDPHESKDGARQQQEQQQEEQAYHHVLAVDAEMTNTADVAPLE